MKLPGRTEVGAPPLGSAVSLETAATRVLGSAVQRDRDCGYSEATIAAISCLEGPIA